MPPQEAASGFIIAESTTHPNVFCVAYSDMMSNGKFSRDIEWVPIVDIYLRDNAAQVSEDLLKNLGEEMYFVDQWVQVVNLEGQDKRSIIGFAKQAGPGGIKVTQLSTHTSREDLDWLLEQPFYDKKSSCFSTDKLQRYSLPACAEGAAVAVAGSGATGAAGAAGAGATKQNSAKKKATAKAQSTAKSATKPATKESSRANFFSFCQGAKAAAAATAPQSPCFSCFTGQGHSFCSKCDVWFCQNCPHSC